MSDLPPDVPDVPDIDDLLDLIDEVVTDWDDAVADDFGTGVEDDHELEGADPDLPDAEADEADEGDAGSGGDADADAVSFAEPLPEEPSGSFRVDVLADALGLAGLEDVEDVLASAGPDLESREAVGALDEAGIGARVEHSTIGDLVERLAAGGEVLLGGGGEAHAVVAIERDGSVVVEPIAGGGRFSVALDHFESMWDALANEVMIVDTPDAAVAFGPGEVVVIPLGVHELAVVGGI